MHEYVRQRQWWASIGALTALVDESASPAFIREMRMYYQDTQVVKGLAAGAMGAAAARTRCSAARACGVIIIGSGF